MASILCVEDEADLREDIVEELEDSGYKVFQASNGREGLEMILKHGPDMVLSDITMPEMNGHEMLVELRKNHPAHSDVPLVFLSALSDRNEVIDGIKLGADDYLVKPIDYPILLAKVEATLRQKERYNKHKNAEMVRLYKSLTSENEAKAAPVVAPEKVANATSAQPSAKVRLSLDAINIAVIGDLDTEIRLFGGMLRRNRSTLNIFTIEDAYFERLDELGNHAVFLWKFDLDRQREFLKKSSTYKPKSIIARLVPRSSKGMAGKRQSSVIDKAIALPVTAPVLIQALSIWIEQKITL